MNRNFKDIEGLEIFIKNKQIGSLSLAHQPLAEYEGVVLSSGIIFDEKKGNYDLDLEWICYGLDLFGENLLEGYVYRFERLKDLIEYILTKHNINVTDIPLKYEFDDTQFCNPIRDAARKNIFEKAWQQFQEDFKRNLFIDHSLQLVYSTRSSNQQDSS